MTDLVSAYQRNDIAEFERILRSNRATIMDDAFIRNYIEDVLKNIRTQARGDEEGYRDAPRGRPQPLSLLSAPPDKRSDKLSVFCFYLATQVLLKLIRPYTRIRIPFISQELNIPARDVEALLVSLILDSKVQGHIDQVNHLLELTDRSKGVRKYAGLDKSLTQLRSLYSGLVNKLAG